MLDPFTDDVPPRKKPEVASSDGREGTVPAAKTAPIAKRNSPVQQQKAEVTLALRARCSGLWIITRDELRCEKDLIPAIAQAGRVPRFWDIANGAINIDGSAVRGDTDYNPPEDPDTMLDLIAKKSRRQLPANKNDRNVWIMRDLSPWLDGPAGAITRRKLRNMLRGDGLSGTSRNVSQAIIILSAGAMPPEELSNSELTVINWSLPDRDEMGDILADAVNVLPDTVDKPLKTKVLNLLKRTGMRDAAIDAAVGLSCQEAQATFARSLIENENINVAAIAAEKKRLIDQEPAMTYYPPRPGGFAAVGGLDVFKEESVKTHLAYSPEARAYGLKLPKGVMLLGISGCGKTLLCQALGSEWGWPVIRLDINALKGKYVGESESRLRGIFTKIDALGQVIIYIDEVEKALEGAVSGSADGGVSADALGAILTWMNDRAGQAFVMMTANDPSKLPPEFMRKGRFDETWWIDLPTRAEREAIVTATLRSNGRDAEELGIDLRAVADSTEGFSGAEIAALIERDAMFAAFSDGAREINTDDMLHATGQVLPMVQTMGDKITRLRETWAGRARLATRPDMAEVTVVRPNSRVLDL